MSRIDPSTTIGKFTVIEDDVVIGKSNIIGSHVVILNGTVIGDNNCIHGGARIGIDPQDYHYKGESSSCVIGDHNIIREYATISKATGKNNKTVIGHGNFIMTYVHIAHDVVIGNNTVISSASQLGGYVEVGDYAVIGGLTGIHQFCRVGEYAMLGAKSYLNKDLLPFLLGRGNRVRVYGVNVRGLVRQKFTLEDIEKIKDLFRMIYIHPRLFTESVQMLPQKKELNPYNHIWISFIRASKRGIVLRKGR
jgi:UDP-N-acetylglucosamine acyltransferase